MVDSSKIREHMEVVGSDGQRVGIVDHVQNNTIKLTKNDSADGQHHTFPIDWVQNVDTAVRLSKSSRDAMQQWQTA